MKCTEAPVSPSTVNPDALPVEPTVADFRRLGAIVTMARYRMDHDCLWNQEDVAEQLWGSKDAMPFSSLARVAVWLAREPRIKTPGGIRLYMSGVIQL